MPLPPGWLPDLTARFTALAGAAAHSDADAAGIATADYADACGHLIHIFELLGPLLAVARSDLDAKVAALRAAASAPGGATLGSLLARDLVGGSICRSCDARHAHRLLLVVRFVQLLVARLAADAAASPSAAAGAAYTESLALIHPWALRAAVRTGMLLGLPGRERFLAAMGETEASAAEHAPAFVAAAARVSDALTSLLAARLPPDQLRSLYSAG